MSQIEVPGSTCVSGNFYLTNVGYEERKSTKYSESSEYPDYESTKCGVIGLRLENNEETIRAPGNACVSRSSYCRRMYDMRNEGVRSTQQPCFRLTWKDECRSEHPARTKSGRMVRHLCAGGFGEGSTCLFQQMRTVYIFRQRFFKKRRKRRLQNVFTYREKLPLRLPDQ